MPARFRARLLAGEPLLGTLLSLPSAEAAEVMDQVGFDWLFVDGEHGPFDAGTLQGVLRAATRTPCLVRVPGSDDSAIARALDAGAAGVIVPQVDDAARAARVAALAHYPPAGTRGFGVARANGYGYQMPASLEAANAAVTVVVQAESATAVANIEAIARVPGIDAILIGPYDLSASLGMPGEVGAPEVTRAIAQVIEACRAAGRAVGVFGMRPEALQPWAALGATLLVAGVDVALLREAAAGVRTGLRRAAGLEAAATP